eukprot:1159931-Pelagomonas_calceolata.AAC.5
MGHVGKSLLKHAARLNLGNPTIQNLTSIVGGCTPYAPPIIKLCCNHAHPNDIFYTTVHQPCRRALDHSYTLAVQNINLHNRAP